MNHSNRGAALAEMSPFSRPALGMQPPAFARAPIGRSMTVSGGDNGMSSWQKPTYPLIGDAGTFLNNNKIPVAIAAAILAGGLAYYYGYR